MRRDPLVGPAAGLEVGAGRGTDPPGARQPARDAVDGSVRAVRRDPRNARRGLARLLGVPRLHPDGDSRRGVGLRPRPARDAGLHRLRHVPGRRLLPPGGARLRRRLPPLAAGCRAGRACPYWVYCPAPGPLASFASADPGTSGLTERVLTTRELNRAAACAPAAARALGCRSCARSSRWAGCRTQYAPSAYIGLWTRLERFDLEQLTLGALERKRVIQGHAHALTIHVVSARDYWLFSDGLGPSRERVGGGGRTARRPCGDIELAVRERLRARARRSRPGRRKELDEFSAPTGSTFWQGVWLELPSACPRQGRGRAERDSFSWPRNGWGEREAGEEAGLVHLLRRGTTASGRAP